MATVNRCALLALLTLVACSPQPVEVHTSLRFTAAQELDALRAALPPALLASLGGDVPFSWPDSAPPLLLRLEVFERARIDFTGSGSLSPSEVAAVRVKRVTARVPLVIDFPLTPVPAELEILVAPFSATSPADPKALSLARGAWPGTPLPADAGPPTFLRELPLAAGGAGALAELLASSNKVALFAVLRTSLDSRLDPHRPRGAADVEVFLELEFVP